MTLLGAAVARCFPCGYFHENMERVSPFHCGAEYEIRLAGSLARERFHAQAEAGALTPVRHAKKCSRDARRAVASETEPLSRSARRNRRGSGIPNTACVSCSRCPRCAARRPGASARSAGIAARGRAGGGCPSRRAYATRRTGRLTRHFARTFNRSCFTRRGGDVRIAAEWHSLLRP